MRIQRLGSLCLKAIDQETDEAFLDTPPPYTHPSKTEITMTTLSSFSHRFIYAGLLLVDIGLHAMIKASLKKNDPCIQNIFFAVNQNDTTLQNIKSCVKHASRVEISPKISYLHGNELIEFVFHFPRYSCFQYDSIRIGLAP